MRTIQLYATGTATGSAIAHVVVPVNATLRAVGAMLIMDSITDGAIVQVSLSLAPTSQMLTNGALDPFFQIGMAGNFVTSGLAQGGVNNVFRLPDVPVRAGEMIYLHAAVAGTVTYQFNGIIYY